MTERGIESVLNGLAWLKHYSTIVAGLELAPRPFVVAKEALAAESHEGQFNFA